MGRLETDRLWASGSITYMQTASWMTTKQTYKQSIRFIVIRYTTLSPSKQITLPVNQYFLSHVRLIPDKVNVATEIENVHY